MLAEYLGRHEIELPENPKVLNIGCGNNVKWNYLGVTGFLLGRGLGLPHYVGVDLREEAFGQAKEALAGLVHFIAADTLESGETLETEKYILIARKKEAVNIEHWAKRVGGGSMRDLRVGAVCMRSETGEIRENLGKTSFYVSKASEAGAGIVCFPELSLTGYSLRATSRGYGGLGQGAVIESYTGKDEGLMLVDLKAESLNEVRKHRMRYFLPHRRPELYAEISSSVFRR